MKIKEKLKIDIASLLVIAAFKLQRPFTTLKNINFPEISPVIFALRHCDQCALYSVKNRNRLFVLISKSNDGEIIARGTKAMGIQTVRGSEKRKGASASLTLLEKLEQGNNIAITIDGPKGPKAVVKPGIINIAKISQAPIVPMVWYSPSPFFLEFNSWDGFRFPLFRSKLIVLYGDPIYVPNELNDEEIEFYRLKVEKALQELWTDAVENYETYLKS